MKKSLAILSLGALFLCSCAITPTGSSGARFSETSNADLIVQYYSDDTIFVLKPDLTQGSFRTICQIPEVVDYAKRQPNHDLAVVILNRFMSQLDEQNVQQRWTKILEPAGFQRIVFLLGRNGAPADGLYILPNQTSGLLSRND